MNVLDLNQNKMEKAAVELYNQEIKELFNQFQDGEISNNMFHMQRLVALTKAEEMEKQQIINAWEDVGADGVTTAEEYYEKTFKSE